MEAYSKEFRAKVLAARDAGESTHEVAVRFGVSKAWVRRIVQQRRETGQVAPKTTRERTPTWRAWADWLLVKLKDKPDSYLHELQTALQEERGTQVCLQTISEACRALGYSRKKRRSSPPSNTDRTSPSGVRSGGRPKSKSIPAMLSSSTKPGRKRT